MKQLQLKDIASYIRGYKEKEIDLIYHSDALRRPYGMSFKSDLRERTIQALWDELQCYEALDRSVPVGVIAFNLEWQQTYVNTAFCKMVEWPEKELIGRAPPFDYLPGEQDHDDSISTLKAVFIGKSQNEGIEKRLRRSTGEKFDALLFASPLTDRFHQKIGWVASVIEITKQKQMVQSLQQSQDQLRALASNLWNLRENDKTQLAREIHDSVFQTLIAIKFGLENIQLICPEIPENMNESLTGLLSTVHLAMKDVQNLHMELRPSLLDDFGVISTIDYLCRKFRGTYPDVTIEKVIQLQESDIPVVFRTILYRTCQEALVNAGKHGKASVVRVTLQNLVDSIQLAIQDNGRGFDREKVFAPGSQSSGSGLFSMKEQVELFGGTFLVESSPGGGTNVHATWPCRN
jgi:PAS domain S-box-containing protein